MKKIRLLSTLCVIFIGVYSTHVQAQTTCVIDPSDLIGWWDGDAISGTTVFDVQTENPKNDGILANGATTASGFIGDAFQFDGTDDYVEIPLSLETSLGSADFTLEAWIKTTEANEGYIFSKRAASVTGIDIFPISQRLADLVPQENLIVGAVRFVLGPGVTINGNTIVTDGQWHHVVATRSVSGNRMELYVDGQLEGGNTQITFPDANLRIGLYNGGGFPFDGQIDEAKMFNRVLTPAEVQASFDAGSAGNCNDRDPIDLIEDLVTLVMGLNIKKGISNSLDAKLSSAINALDDLNANNDVAAINSINAFINAVQAQSGNAVSVGDADSLIDTAQAIIDALTS